MTIKLYQKDVDIKNWNCQIASASPGPEAGQYNVWLTETAFFPEGGGQSCDQGIITINGSTFHVIDVQEDGSDVRHLIQVKASLATAISAGDDCQCSLDWERRFDNMQRHCGEHILSGIFYDQCGAVNRGFHMGDNYMTIDMSLEDEPGNPECERPEEITFAIAKRCELLANKVIWNNLPVITFRFDSRDEAEKMPLRKKLAFDEDISIVCIGSPEKAADCVACCGTHPKTSGKVGLIKIFKVENYKNMFRIYFEAGQRALMDYDLKHDILTDLSNKYSSSIEEFPGKIKAQEAKMAQTRNELGKLKKAYTEVEISRLDEIIKANTGNRVIVYELEHMNMDDAFNMSKNYMGKSEQLIMLYSVDSSSFVLASDGNIKCGSLVKEYASFYNGKGGGNDISARAIFSSRDDAMLFADLIEKHLRK